MAPESFRRKSLDQPDETRTFENGKAEVVHPRRLQRFLGSCSSPVEVDRERQAHSGHNSCQVLPTPATRIPGRMAIRLDDGTEEEYGPGDAYVIPPGHDGGVE